MTERDGRVERARALRRDATEHERRLWGLLRDRRLLGYKFVRQFPIGPYVVDFACRRERLVLELDGSQHVDSEHDMRRDRLLVERGYSILRIWNQELAGDPESVVDTILAALQGKLEHGPSPGLRFASAALSPQVHGEGS